MACAFLYGKCSGRYVFTSASRLYKNKNRHRSLSQNRHPTSDKMLNRQTHYGILAMLVCFWWIDISVNASNSRCKLKRYSHKAMQTDLNGRRCWDEIKIGSCWGYCLSYEISHWQFPYKESHHPVCVHGERRPASVKLQNCDPGVQPGTDIYHFVEAVNCKCQVCSSEDTSCEWLPPDSSLLDGLILKEELLEELE